MLSIGDRVKCIKPLFPRGYEQFSIIGNEYEIEDISDGFIYIIAACGIGKMHDYEFEGHYVKIDDINGDDNMLKIGDKIKMVTNVGRFNMVGEVFEITSLPDNEIHFFHKDWGYGYMSEDEFEKHFEKVEIKQWTDWIETKDGFSYKTDNEKYVDVKKDGIHVESRCHPCDKFSLAKGIAICLDRIKEKEKEETLDEVISVYGSPYLYNIVLNDLKSKSKDDNEVKEILIDVLKNLNGKIANLETSVEEKVYNDLNSEHTGIKYYTIKFTEIV